MDDDSSNSEPNARMNLRRARGINFDHMTGSETPSSDSISGDDSDTQPSTNPSSLIRSGVPPGMGSAPDNPRDRLNQASRAGSPGYAKEYRLQLLHRLLLRKVPLDQIAQELQVSIATVEKDRAELRKRLREAAREIDIDELIGNQSAYYDEVTAMSLRIASASGGARGEGATPIPMRLAALRTSLAANADRTRFLNTAGVFDVLRFRKADSQANQSDIATLMERTMQALASLESPESSLPSTEPPFTPKRITRGRFDPMTFDDRDSSSSDSEIQEL